MNKRVDSNSLITQRVLGQNEDTIAAIIENMQLGKLEDCVQQYSILHNNLVALAHELDNIPTEDADAYLNIESFPDELYRQDPLDELLSLEDKNLPKLPLIPQCNLCHQQNRSRAQCRLENKHIEPSYLTSDAEQSEIFQVAQLVMAKLRKKQKGAQDSNKKKRQYKRWDEEDRYSLEIAMRIFGASNYSRISNVLVDRNESQIRHFIAKLSKTPNYQLPLLEDLLKSPPAGYHPPALLEPIFKASADNCLEEALSSGSLYNLLSSSPNVLKSIAMSALEDGGCDGNSNSRVIGRQGKNNFADLINAANNLGGANDQHLSYIDELEGISGQPLNYSHDNYRESHEQQFTPSSSQSRQRLAHQLHDTISSVNINSDYRQQNVYQSHHLLPQSSSQQQSLVSVQPPSNSPPVGMMQVIPNISDGYGGTPQPPPVHHPLKDGIASIQQPFAFPLQPTTIPVVKVTANRSQIQQSASFPMAGPENIHQYAATPFNAIPVALDRVNDVTIVDDYDVTANLDVISPQTGTGVETLGNNSKAMFDPLLNQLHMIYGATSLMTRYDIARMMEQKVNNEAFAQMQQAVRQRPTSNQEKAAMLFEYYKLSGTIRAGETTKSNAQISSSHSSHSSNSSGQSTVEAPPFSFGAYKKLPDKF